MGDVINIGERRASQDRRIVWCLCWSCGHSHRFHSDEVLRDAGSYERFEVLALCLVCEERDAVLVQPRPKPTWIPRPTG